MINHGAVVLVMIFSASVLASPPVEGDPALLELMRDALLANEGRYPHGELQATMERGDADARSPDEQIEARVQWDGDRTRISGMTMALKHAEGVDDYDPETLIEIIVDGEKGTISKYFRKSRVARTDSLDEVGQPLLTMLRPDQLWYGDTRPWIEMVGPHPNFSQDNVERYLVRRLDENHIEMVREDKTGARFRIVTSLEHDGNVVEYEGHDPNSGETTSGTYQWARDAAGRCYLDEYYSEFGYMSPRADKPVKIYKKYKTTSFNPDVKPPRSTFDLRSIPLASRTLVEDKVAGRRYRVGDSSESVVVDELEELISELRKRGFARPDRSR